MLKDGTRLTCGEGVDESSSGSEGWSQSVYHVACAPLAVRLLGVRSDAQTQPDLGFRASGSRIGAWALGFFRVSGLWFRDEGL